jgi:hypothetical protein
MEASEQTSNASEQKEMTDKEIFKVDLRQKKEKNIEKVVDRLKDTGLGGDELLEKVNANRDNLEKEKYEEIKKGNHNVADKIAEKLEIANGVRNEINKYTYIEANPHIDDRGLSKEKNEQLKKEKDQDVGKNNKVDQDNLKYLMNKLKYTGFPDNQYTRDKVIEIMKSNESGTFKHQAMDKQTMEGNSVDYEIKINKAKGNDKFYFGGYDANLKNEEKGLDRSLSMASSKNTYTAKEALNLLEGRMVKREFQNGKSGFVGIDFNSEKNKYGNHKLNIVSKEDKIDVAKAVDQSAIILPKSEKYDDNKMKEFLIKSLEKGNLVKSNIKNSDSQSVPGQVKFNPFKGEIDHYEKIDDYKNQYKKLPDDKLELNQGITAEGNEESKKAVVKR